MGSMGVTVSSTPAGQDGVRSLSEQRFMTVAEVASIMRVSRMTVYRMVHEGQIASVKVGRSFRVPEHAVNAYLQAAYTEAG